MKTRLLAFIGQLRGAGIAIGVSESLDAMAATSTLGVEADALRVGLATTLIKDEADRPTFDALFDRFFAVPARSRGKREPSLPAGEGGGAGRTQPAEHGQPLDPRQPHEHRPSGIPEDQRKQGPSRRDDRAAQRAMRRRALKEMPFEAMDARDVEEADELVDDLSRRFRAHLRRRYQAASTGRLDFRRTIRISLGSGGVPIAPAFRSRRPGQLDLIALCDVSYSATTAARFCLALLAPASGFFRRVHLFGYVDHPVAISFEHGHVIPHQPLDLSARSDFGRVLQQLWQQCEPLFTRNTAVLVLGDARNNRRPPRADILARIHDRVRLLAWLNPESEARWNCGDSVFDTYARHCDRRLAATNLNDLTRALKSAL